MSKLKNFLSFVLLMLLLTFGLAAPAFALDVSSNIDSALISVNGGTFFQTYGYLPSSYVSDRAGFYDVSSLDILFPFSSVTDQLVSKISLLTGSVTSYGGYSCDLVSFENGTVTSIKSLPHYATFISRDSFSAPVGASTSTVYESIWSVRVYCDGLTSSDVGNFRFIRFRFYNCNYQLALGIQGEDTRSTLGTGNTYFNLSSGTFSSSSMPSYQSTTSGNAFIAKATSALSGHMYFSKTYLNGDMWGTGRASSSAYAAVQYSTVANSSDASAVAQLKQINGTLDGMASNLKSITDDFKARENVGTDISGTATDTDISSGTSGLSSGSLSISSGISGLPSFGDMMAPCVGYISFLTAPIQMIFNFGNGYLLYIATAMVILSVIFFVIRRMGGSDD